MKESKITEVSDGHRLSPMNMLGSRKNQSVPGFKQVFRFIAPNVAREESPRRTLIDAKVHRVLALGPIRMHRALASPFEIHRRENITWPQVAAQETLNLWGLQVVKGLKERVIMDPFPLEDLVVDPDEGIGLQNRKLDPKKIEKILRVKSSNDEGIEADRLLGKENTT